MIYNKKYDLYVDENLVIYYYNKGKDKLIQSKQSLVNGYYQITHLGRVYAHRLIWETFNGEIPDGMEIDHINTIKTDNRLSNLRLVSHKDNINNPITIKHMSEIMKGKTRTEFGIKFKEHYNISKSDNPKLYSKEQMWYIRHNKCRWE